MNLDEVTATLKKHSDLFNRAYIFGSITRVRHDEHSDIDIVLIRETDRAYFDRIREVFDLFFDLKKAHMLIYNEKEYHKFLTGDGYYFQKKIFE